MKPAGERSLTERAYDHIRRKLLRGDLVPGARLVNRVLAKEVGSSTIPVREAISRLVSEGLAETVPGAGAFIRRPDRRELGLLFDLRESVEPIVAAEAARQATEDEVWALEEILAVDKAIAEEVGARRGHGTEGQLHRWLENDDRMHAVLVDATRSTLLSRAVGELRLLNAVFSIRRPEARMLTPEVVRTTHRINAALTGAVKRRDPKQAAHWMREHIRDGRRITFAYLNGER